MLLSAVHPAGMQVWWQQQHLPCLCAENSVSATAAATGAAALAKNSSHYSTAVGRHVCSQVPQPWYWNTWMHKQSTYSGGNAACAGGSLGVGSSTTALLSVLDSVLDGSRCGLLGHLGTCNAGVLQEFPAVLICKTKAERVAAGREQMVSSKRAVGPDASCVVGADAKAESTASKAAHALIALTMTSASWARRLSSVGMN
jgi:hypothetical protein